MPNQNNLFLSYFVYGVTNIGSASAEHLLSLVYLYRRGTIARNSAIKCNNCIVLFLKLTTSYLLSECPSK